MAESTRFKTLEEQIRKQEIKLQEVMEGLQTSQLQQQQMRNEFHTKLEESNKRMEGLIAEMKQEFSIFMRAMMSKEKAVLEEVRQRIEQAPLLPTLPLNQRLQIGSENKKTARKEAGAFQVGRNRVELWLCLPLSIRWAE
ncbi:uncharacterized protein [Coffea arabica]|uniref:Coiled-coil domain-containing protein 153 n=1 Tax=Coffea arabica TaxID=13443 RepID=A0ABM4VQ62_COFAR